MTRDEARFVLNAPLGEHFGHRIPDGVDDAWLDAWVKLGMLKLDEPKSVETKFKELVTSIPWDQRYAATLLLTIEAHGLKIVEK